MVRVLLVVAVAVIVGGAAFFVVRSGDETARDPGTVPEEPQSRSAQSGDGGVRPATTRADVATTTDRTCAPGGSPEVTGRTRIGSFAAPEGVPDYEVIEEQPDGKDGACAVRLLADTKSRSRADFVLIVRDLKARYADYDAASVEFIDLSTTLDYLGGALIFNTPEGANFLGYTRFLPNSDGYVVSAAE